MRGLFVILAVAAGLLVPALASAEPKILRAGLEQSSLTGQGLTFAVEASDPQQGVTSMAVGLPNGAGAFGESSCRLDRKGREKPAPGLGAGKRSRFAFPFNPAATGLQTIDVTVTSGACGLTPRQAHKAVKVNVGLADLPALPGPKNGPKALSSQLLCDGMDVVPTSTNLKQIRGALLCLLNIQRGARGLGLLHSHSHLRKAATRHSRDMLRRNFFDHQGPGGPTLADRLRRVGYWPASAGENIGMGVGAIATPANMVLAWMDSDGHRENILDKRYQDVGIGVVASSGRIAYTTDFGQR